MKIFRSITIFVIFSLHINAVVNAQNSMNALITKSEASFTMKNAQSGIYSVKFSAIIFNNKGNDVAKIFIYNDSFRTLSKFSGTLTPDNGKEKKIRISDLSKTEYSQGLFSDDIYYTYFPEASYPYTINYEYQIEYQNGILNFPPFIPLSDEKCALLEGSYKLIIPNDVNISYYSTLEPVITQSSSNQTEYLWRINTLNPIEYEIFSPPFHRYLPIILAEPVEFSYDKKSGSQESWEKLGLWIYDLIKDRDKLPENERSKVIEMTADAKSDIEKIKILYDYLGKKSRYVSIQLGIGGLQPFPVEEVVKTGFGDCKALSLYMISMLNTIGIEANYIVISSEEKRLIREFPSVSQMDHVIVEAIPGKDTIWLECTNPTIPFGYIHKNIAGHDALKITPQGGEFITLNDYPDTLNTISESVEVYLNSDGSAKISFSQSSKCKRFESVSGFSKLNNKEKSDYIASGKNFTIKEINNISHTISNSDMIPAITISADIVTQNYAKISQNRIFVEANPFTSLDFNLKKSTRKNPIYIENGFAIRDTITLHIPDGYSIETRFDDKKNRTDFGECGYKISSTDSNLLHIITNFTLFAGEYASERYEEFLKFIQESKRNFALQIVLIKSSDSELHG